MTDDTDPEIIFLPEPEPKTMSKPKTNPPETSQVESSIYVDLLFPAPWAVCKSGLEPLGLRPGLNIVSASTWASYIEHPPVVEAIKVGTLTEIKELAATDDLIARTKSREALMVLRELELSKPLVASPSKRRNQGIVSELDRRITK